MVGWHSFNAIAGTIETPLVDKRGTGEDKEGEAFRKSKMDDDTRCGF